MTSDDDVPTDLTPNDFDSFIGQANLKRELEVKIQAAREEERPLGHILLVTVPGAGKTTLARLIAEKLGDDFASYVCPMSDKLIAQVVRSHSGIVLMDEIHRFKSRLDGLLTLIGPGRFVQLASGARLEAPELTVIGATTEPQAIPKALWDRFDAAGGVPMWDPYSDDELTAIVGQMSRQLGIKLDEKTCRTFGTASAGIPRHAEKFVLTHRDLTITNAKTGIAPPSADDTLALLRTASDGVTARHHHLLTTLDLLGGTKGLKPLAGVMRVSEKVVEDLEVLLIEMGYIELTDRGRDLTAKGHRYLQGGVAKRRGRKKL